MGGGQTECFAIVGFRPTWYLVKSVLHTPVSSIIATRNGIAPLEAMVSVADSLGYRAGPLVVGEMCCLCYLSAPRQLSSGLSLLMRGNRLDAI